VGACAIARRCLNPEHGFQDRAAGTGLQPGRLSGVCSSERFLERGPIGRRVRAKFWHIIGTFAGDTTILRSVLVWQACPFLKNHLDELVRLLEDRGW